MNKSTMYIIITIILFLALNDPILKFLAHGFNLSFWINEIIIAIIVIALVLLISWLVNKFILKK
ncbi:hypothetical protein [Companilactobacillus versmoldensis]|uniref:hypothetical protein n=1 Tax=Companilactobacillus versmoldensis TaxID=194326 RepID=UPI0002492F8F|nr:hypothetical protein [Companilactobacillus versmoldensis]